MSYRDHINTTGYSGVHCEDCMAEYGIKKELTNSALNWSKKNYGRPLCFEHQQGEKLRTIALNEDQKRSNP